MIVLLKAARTYPRHFWVNFGLIAVFVATIAWAVTYDAPWVAAILVLVCGWGIFCACMTLYQVGQQVAYQQAAKWAEEVRQSIEQGQGELSSALAQLDALGIDLGPPGRRWQGPS